MQHISLCKINAADAPTEWQRAGFVSYVELQKVRKKLTFGSKERLLLSFYGGCIPPLRNDLHAYAIQVLKCDDDQAAQQALLHQVTPNEILLPIDRNSAGVLILREFKTQDRKHPAFHIDAKYRKLYFSKSNSIFCHLAVLHQVQRLSRSNSDRSDSDTVSTTA